MIRLSSAEKIIASFILFIAALLALRIGYANNTRYLFLLWNLFLAWIPFELSVAFTKRCRSKWYNYFLLACWLLFFPNALYIITDLIHLEVSGDKVPVWFDAMLLFTCAIAGLIMAFVSLRQAEIFLEKNISPKHIQKFILAALFAGSFGVYIGRFLRWNSWNVITDPFALFKEISLLILFPLQHYRAWITTVLFTALFSLLYFAIKNLSGITRAGEAVRGITKNQAQD